MLLLRWREVLKKAMKDGMQLSMSEVKRRAFDVPEGRHAAVRTLGSREAGATLATHARQKQSVVIGDRQYVIDQQQPTTSGLQGRLPIRCSGIRRRAL